MNRNAARRRPLHRTTRCARSRPGRPGRRRARRGRRRRRPRARPARRGRSPGTSRRRRVDAGVPRGAGPAVGLGRSASCVSADTATARTAVGRRPARRVLGLGGRLLEDDVGVGAADAERGDAGAARPARLRPRPRLGEQRDRAGRPVDVRGRARRRAASAAARRAASPCTILITPATPAAACVWPMFDLIEPSHSGRRRRGPGRRWPAAPGPRSGRRASVPVPCASTASTSAGGQPGVGQRARMTRCCEGPFGAVRPLEAPSWLTAEPRTTASTRWPLRAGVGQPLQQQHARALGPAGAVGGVGERLAAAVGGQAALPAELDERRRGGHHRHAAGQRQRALAARAAPAPARCSATSDDEQAVSTVTAGPSRPKV